MSAGKRPGNSLKLTNVSIVRLKKAGKKFELGCYKNSVRAWRSGAQKDLSEVIQIDNIFSNVGKGLVSSSDDLMKAFGTIDIQVIIQEILKKGEIQVGEKERAVELEELRREICTEVAGRCVDPGSQRPYTVGMIEKAMTEIGYSVNTSKSAKVQAIELIKTLQASNTIPIARANMRVRVTMPSKDGKRLKDTIMALVSKVEDDDWSENWELTTLIEPGSFRLIDDLLQNELKGRGRIETLAFSVVVGDERLE